jgi:hypothetical protein
LQTCLGYPLLPYCIAFLPLRRLSFIPAWSSPWHTYILIYFHFLCSAKSSSNRLLLAMLRAIVCAFWLMTAHILLSDGAYIIFIILQTYIVVIQANVIDTHALEMHFVTLLNIMWCLCLLLAITYDYKEDRNYRNYWKLVWTVATKYVGKFMIHQEMKNCR